MRRIAWLGLVLVPLVAARAQVRGSVIGGYVSAKLAASFQGTTVTFASRTGFAVGLGMTRPVARDIEFAPEFLYVQKGFDQTAGTDELKFKLGYLEVPVLFRAMFAAGASARPFITAGPDIGVRVSCSGESTSGGSSVSQDCTDVGNSGIKSFDFGVMFGAGVTVRSVTVTARYDAGLADIQKNPPSGQSLKNRALMILVGLTVK